MDIEFNAADLTPFRNSLSREWLETNGRGGFASGTIANCRTRKYHGLLNVNLSTPPGPFNLLADLEDWVVAGNQVHPISVHQYDGGAYSPDGHTRQTRFALELMPAFTYKCGDLTVTRRIMMPHRRDAVLIRYDVTGKGSGALCIRPLLAFRSLHQVTHANGALNGQTDVLPGGFRIRPYATLPPLFMQGETAGSFNPEPLWYFKFRYAQDAERGFEHLEDLFSPGLLRFELKPGTPVILAASTEPLGDDPEQLWTRELERRQKENAGIASQLPADLDARSRRTLLRLRHTARQFLIEHPLDGPALHAGYHWFGAWGRDTLIALPGIAFYDGALDFGARILKTLARLERRGLLPNFLNPDGSGAYTAADPSLWYFWTIQQYLAAGGSLETVRREFWPAMLSIIRNFLAGTANGIAADADGLLRAGSAGQAVSWMDAQVGGRPIVARWGYLVELNALWYNALCFTQELAQTHFNETLEFLPSDYTVRARHAFVAKFWMPDGNGLFDSVNEFTADGSLRPNALLAASLPYTPLRPEQIRTVVQAVRRELLTPIGLRSLTPADLRYRGQCQGENWVRELAYHQGSVWPWFLPHFAEALFRAEGRTPATEKLFEPVLEAIDRHLREAGVGSISEVFDGDEPYTPRGAISQAWNVAETLRLLYLLKLKPHKTAATETPAAPVKPKTAATIRPAPARPTSVRARPATTAAKPAGRPVIRTTAAKPPPPPAPAKGKSAGK